MGRLIEEDDVMRMLTSVELNNGIIADAKTELRNVKTAYDKEAVVEQLKNEEKFWESSYDYQIGKEKARSYGHAIELVKAGGIDG